VLSTLSIQARFQHFFSIHNCADPTVSGHITGPRPEHATAGILRKKFGYREIIGRLSRCSGASVTLSIQSGKVGSRETCGTGVKTRFA
jgi:hypothetical protein